MHALMLSHALAGVGSASGRLSSQLSSATKYLRPCDDCLDCLPRPFFHLRLSKFQIAVTRCKVSFVLARQTR